MKLVSLLFLQQYFIPYFSEKYPYLKDEGMSKKFLIPLVQ
jgi:hypothetical protein